MTYGTGYFNYKLYTGLFHEAEPFAVRKAGYAPGRLLAHIGTAHLCFPTGAVLDHGLPEYGSASLVLGNPAKPERSIISARKQELMEEAKRQSTAQATPVQHIYARMHKEGNLTPNTTLGEWIRNLRGDKLALVCVLGHNPQKLIADANSSFLADLTKMMYVPVDFCIISGSDWIIKGQAGLEQRVISSWKP